MFHRIAAFCCFMSSSSQIRISSLGTVQGQRLLIEYLVWYIRAGPHRWRVRLLHPVDRVSGQSHQQSSTSLSCERRSAHSHRGTNERREGTQGHLQQSLAEPLFKYSSKYCFLHMCSWRLLQARMSTLSSQKVRSQRHHFTLLHFTLFQFTLLH